MSGGLDRLQAMSDKATEVAAGFINYDDITFDEDEMFVGLDAFTKGLQDQISIQDQWSANLTKAAKIGGTDFVEALLQMGPTAAPVLDELVKNFEETSGASGAAWDEAMQAILRSVDYNAGQAGVSMGLAMDDLRAKLKDEDLVMELSASLDPDTLTTVSRALDSVSRDAAKTLANALANNEIGVSELVQQTKVASRPKIAFDPVLSEDARDRVQADLNSFAARTDLEIPADLELSPDTTVAEFKKIVGNPDLFPAIKGNLDISLVDAYDKYESVRQYMLVNGIDVNVAANPNLAYLSLDSLIQFGNGQVTQVLIDGLNDPGKGKVYQIVELANGMKAAVVVDADTGLAVKGIQVLTQETEDGKVVPVDANTDAAKEAIGLVKDLAEEDTSSYHKVESNVDSVANKIASLDGANTSSTHTVFESTVKGKVDNADGNLISYFAKGGIRENHVAQVAPAGAMRLWAEPETGGEAYIPLAPSKRKRSAAILQETASRFGYDLVRAGEVAKFADGGAYRAQQLNRAATGGGHSAASSGWGLSTSDRQFFSQMFREVVVTANGQALTGLTNNINERNARFGR